METIINEDILQGVGKKLRNGYLAKNVSASKVMECYQKNLKEADAFSCFGWTVFEMTRLERATHNPIIRKKLQQAIEAHTVKQEKSCDQNKQNLEKLEKFRTDALGIGLRKVLSQMKRQVKHSSKIEAKIVLLLLETEFANLSAKKLHNHKTVIYERKTILLERLAELLKETDWRYGISSNTGKNASYIVYIYLPNGEQLSWHCNEYQMLYYYPEIDCMWDGQVCMTMEKILTYIGETFHIGKNEKSKIAA
ncbi:MAG: hypothetical protein IJK15_00615 [Bacteroidaceae bacterium]|nr:hypothetical protein [Bacteroidaceae bacterium]